MDELSRVILPASLESLEQLITFVSTSAREAGVETKKVSELEIVTEEALVNVFNYAYGEVRGDVEVVCGLEGAESFVVEITDSGTPFNILSTADPDISADVSERKIGGLGIFLIKKMTDDVRYRNEEGRNVLTLVMKRTNSRHRVQT